MVLGNHRAMSGQIITMAMTAIQIVRTLTNNPAASL